MMKRKGYQFQYLKWNISLRNYKLNNNNNNNNSNNIIIIIVMFRVIYLKSCEERVLM